MIIDSWNGCYPSNWKGVIVPEAMAHPAKYSSKLIRKIYEHMFQEKWLQEGDRVLDPFGGVALGALDAMRLGLDWCGVELEAKFHGLGNQNIEKWLSQFGKLPRWGSACLSHGDSRKLLEMIQSADVAVSSPPYEGTDVNYRKNGLRENGKEPYQWPCMQGQEDNYGSTPGQLSAMKSEGFQAALSSPPYSDVMSKNNGGNRDETIPWLISLLSILMLWQMGNGSAWGPRLGLATSLLWVVYASYTRQWGLLPRIVVVGMVHTRNMLKWRRDGRL